MASRKRSGGTWCSAPNCQNSRKNGWRLFSFPREEERCRKWVQNCRRSDLIGKPVSYLNTNCSLCFTHFEPTQFMNITNPKSRLIWNAVPTLFDVPNPPKALTTKRKLPHRKEESPKKTPRKPKENQDVTDQDDAGTSSVDLQSVSMEIPTSTTDTSRLDTPLSSPVPEPSSSSLASRPSTAEELSPRKRALKVKVKNLQQKCRRLEKKRYQKCECSGKGTKSMDLKRRQLIEELKVFLPPSTLTFVATQIRLSGRRKEGNRWTTSEKSLSLSLLHASPKAYRMLQKILNLPSVSTLGRTMQKVNIFPGFSDNILQALKRKVSAMPPEAAVCAVVFDEMTIKEELSYNIEEDNVEGLEDFGNQRSHYAANHATVFMVRGLLEPWKQAVGYVFSSGPISGNLLKSLLSRCIDKLMDIGLDVKAIICDQGSNNRKALEGLGIKEERPYFFHQEKRVYTIYDPPHLLKNIRKNFKKTGFYKNNNNIEWGYIEEFFQMDSKNSVRMAPKLTQKHIKLPGFSSLRVKFASQVLSHSVAAGISTMVTLRALYAEATETALFVERMDQLFNAFNSSIKCSHQKMRHAMSEKSGHKEFLQDTLSWLSTLHSNSSRPLPCLSGWKISIRSLLLLWEDLQDVYRVKFLYTSRMNQDCIENLFSVIRGKGGHGDNPSPRQFRLFLRQVMVDSILIHSKSSNCLEDGDQFLLTLNNIETQRKYTTPLAEAPASPQQHGDFDASLMGLTLILPPEGLTHQEENILTYMSGYIARKMRTKVCQQCSDMLIGELEGISKETLLTQKQLPDLKGGGLVTPSSELVTIVEQLEIAYKKSQHLLHMDKVRARFLERLEKEGSCLICPSGQCKLGSLVVNLYLNIKLHFTLKDNNRQFAASSKRQNRKMLKLQHL